MNLRCHSLRCTVFAVAALLVAGGAQAQRPNGLAPATQVPGAGTAASPEKPSNTDTTANPLLQPPGVRASGCPQPLAHILPGSTVTSGDWVQVERTRCYGTCPAYTVRLGADGSVRWHGESSVKVTGDARGQVNALAAANLMQQLRDQGFAQLCTSYTRSVTDSAAILTTLSVGNSVRQVRDYAASAPVWLRDFDERIDALADTHQWRHGEAIHERLDNVRLSQDATGAKPGRNLMMKSAATGDRGAIEVMLQQRVPVDAEDGSGWTALIYAAGVGPLDQVRQLLASGADPNHRSREGETPLFAAAMSPDDAAAKLRLLQRAGANVQASDNEGTTVLMVAVRRYDQTAVLKVLLQMGANPAVRNARGQTALDVLNASRSESVPAAEYEAALALLKQAH